MNFNPIKIKILESTANYIKVKLPFLDIPAKMTHSFFQSRIDSGYFKIRDKGTQLSEDYSNTQFA